MALDDLFSKTIKYSFYLLFFLTPLVFVPWTHELFEFNKMFLVYFLSLVIFFSWAGKVIVEKKLVIRRTPLDIPLILWLASSILSTVFSLHPYTSIWGYYSRSHGGLLSTTAYIFLYYAFMANIDRKYSQKTIKALLAAGFLTSAYAILERLGIDQHYWVQDVRSRVFSTLGQPNWLGAFIDSLIFIPLARLLAGLKTKSKKSAGYFWAYGLTLVTVFLALIFTNSKSAILAFWLSLAFFTLIAGWQAKKRAVWKYLALTWLVSLLIFGLFGNQTYSYLQKLPDWLKSFSIAQPVVQSNQTGQTMKYPAKISESSEIRRVVWQGAIKIFKNYPFLGSGVETFAYSYYRFRPKEHNLLSEWDFLYNKAHNEFLNILACQGLLGISAYLSIIIVFSRQAWKRMVNQKPTESWLIQIGLTASWLTLLITNFFGFSVVVTGLLFYFLPAFSFNLSRTGQTQVLKFGPKPKKAAGQPNKWQKALLAGVAVASLLSLNVLVRRWQADYFFAQAEKLYQGNYLLPAMTKLEKAVRLNPHQAIYHAWLGKTSAKMAVAYSQQESSQSAQVAEQLAGLAETQAEISQILNPVHLNFYKNRAEVYLYLTYLDPKFNQKAIETLKQATKLAPTDAKLVYNIGLLLFQQEQEDLAKEYFKKAVELKPNYARVYIKLAEIYQKQGQLEKAEQKLRFVLKNINPDDQGAEKMLKEVLEKG